MTNLATQYCLDHLVTVCEQVLRQVEVGDSEVVDICRAVARHRHLDTHADIVTHSLRSESGSIKMTHFLVKWIVLRMSSVSSAAIHCNPNMTNVPVSYSQHNTSISVS